jgi:hypothetical protein
MTARNKIPTRWSWSGSGVAIAVATGVALLALSALPSIGWAAIASPKSKAVDAHGHLSVPTGYRSTYEYLGTWSVADDKGGPGAKQLHIVYASPGSVAAFRKTGQFPDGAVLVKEVFATNTGTMTTGTVSREDALAGWFVMVKDSKGSHPGNALWGDGWGWSWFDAGKPDKTTSTDYKKDCLGCHVPAKSTDWIYTQGYPVLKGD